MQRGERGRKIVLTVANTARALASPIRKCGLTQVALPRYFLQDFEAVKHPETGAFWYAPGPLSLEKVQPKYWPSEAVGQENSVRDGRGHEVAPKSNSEVTDEEVISGDDGTTKTLSSLPGSPVDNDGRNSTIGRHHKAPITTYSLCRKSVLDKLGQEKKWSPKLLGSREGTAVAPAARKAVFRPDMGDVLLSMMRQTAVDALITRCTRTAPPLDKFVEPVVSWDEIKDVKRRGCVLLLRGDHDSCRAETTPVDGEVDDGAVPLSEYATVDLDGASYGSKMPVYDLNWLFGVDEVARLRAMAPTMFGKDRHQRLPQQQQQPDKQTASIYVLKTWRTHSMVNLHLLLWRLQGYLAKGRAPTAAA